jgi:hypothetical protein
MLIILNENLDFRTADRSGSARMYRRRKTGARPRAGETRGSVAVQRFREPTEPTLPNGDDWMPRGKLITLERVIRDLS